ncbi:hypothetical protein [Myroides guanonis]|uniref:Uncharacterized protein n=1 Tax=Myroides guanonis TaxID=1150112 RepID=A0A1I3PJM6_9FLAO|nr:hypothetical protein [Myroides guanonis]SFJ21236.1 hypothetical protein SAMN04487893_104144 [Myroides guanonis]
MKTDLDLKELWNKQDVPMADVTVILGLIKKYKRTGFRKMVFLNSVLMITILVLLLIWISYNPQLIITKIGIVLGICSIFFVVISTSKLIPLYKKSDTMLSNSDYLTNLIEIKSIENHIQTKVMNVYFILLTVGTSLYMYEYTMSLSWYFVCMIYGVFFIWIGFNWFVLRPRIVEKSRKKIDDFIYQIKTLEKQWGSSDIY